MPERSDTPLGFPPPGLSDQAICLASAPQAPGARRALAARLWRGLGGGPTRGQGALRLERGSLGQPLTWLDHEPGPWLSFSRLGQVLWAAMSLGARVGIDVAEAAEFPAGYPLHRLARPAEWDLARAIHPATAQAAALLWAAKEAAVKALGLGFHFQEPRQIEVIQAAPLGRGLLLSVVAGQPVRVWLSDQGRHWLALAVAGQPGH